MTWLGFFALQLGFIFMVLGLGYWAATRIVNYLCIKKAYWIDRVCIGVFVVVFLLALSGIIVLFFPWSMRHIIGALILATLFILSGYIFIRGKHYRDIIGSTKIEKIFLVGVVVMSGMGLSISLLPVKLPDHLVDGPYVAKHNYLGVRVQYMTGNLPTDNSLPHVVSEYLLRGISFKKERPVMPGQEVSNRPILVSLLLVPIRAAFSLPAKMPEGLPKFNYLGTAWPDFSVLMKDDFAYLFSLSIGITLNALIILVVGAFAVRAGNESTFISVGVLALMMSSPYFIFQTIFTWPKELAAFFVLFSILSYVKLKNPILSGAFMAFGYLSHPYAIVFLGGVVLYEAYGFLKRRVHKEQFRGSLAIAGTEHEHMKEDYSRINMNATSPIYHDVQLSDSERTLNVKYIASFLVAFSILVAPWFLWTKLILHIPSDLVSQNFLQRGQSLIDFIWVRPVNFFKALFLQFTHYPFDLNGMVWASSVTISGAVGVLVFLFSLMYVFEKGFERDKLFLIYIPSLLLITIFSNPALPVLHGLQGPIALLVLVGVTQMRKALKPNLAYIILSMQVLINVVLLGRYFNKLV